MNDLTLNSVQDRPTSVTESNIPADSIVDAPLEEPQPKAELQTDRLDQLSIHLYQQAEALSATKSRRRTLENNQRQFSRCPILEEHTTAALNLNGRWIECRLVELSIGGFGVIVPGQMQLKTGTVGSLRAPGFNYVVSVTRLESRPDGIFIGLKQLEEVLDQKQFRTGETSPLVSSLVAGIAGILIAAVSYYFITGK